MAYEWVESTVYDCFPKNAVWCSKDKTGSDIFIGQYSFEKSVLLAKIIPRVKEAFVPYNGKEIPALSYRVLVSNNNGYQIWKRVVDDDNIPTNSVQCGYDGKKNQLFVGRAFHKGYLLPGYVHSKTKVIHIAYKGHEYKYADFEVLINNDQKNNENNNSMPILDTFENVECVSPTININIMSPIVNNILVNLNDEPLDMKGLSPDISLFSAKVRTESPNINAEFDNLKTVTPKIKKSPRMSPFKVLNRTFSNIIEPKSPRY